GEARVARVAADGHLQARAAVGERRGLAALDEEVLDGARSEPELEEEPHVLARGLRGAGAERLLAGLEELPQALGAELVAELLGEDATARARRAEAIELVPHRIARLPDLAEVEVRVGELRGLELRVDELDEVERPEPFAHVRALEAGPLSVPVLDG